jgi:hypothetical protein
MPWRECSVMDERMQFVASRRGDGGTLREFGISRKTRSSSAIRNAAFGVIQACSALKLATHLATRFLSGRSSRKPIAYGAPYYPSRRRDLNFRSIHSEHSTMLDGSR